MNLMSDFEEHSMSIPSNRLTFDCVKTVVQLENCRDLYTYALGPFDYHIKVKY